MKILVIGDSCKDVFVYGDCSRLAPAAPVPVFVEKYRKSNKGMAGNVYENVLSLGVKCDIITNKVDIIKIRYVEEKIDRIKDINIEALQQYDAVIISDYNKGFLLEEDIQFIADNHELVFLDTKKLLGDWARNIKFIKINEQEYERTRHLLVDKEWLDEKLIVTMGSRGCIYSGNIYRVLQVEIKDLTGAGDSFLAALARKFVEEGNIFSSINYANDCATIVVQQKGVNTIR